MCVPVSTIDIVDNGPEENIDYYDLQNVCDETKSVKGIGECKYLFYKLKNNNYHNIILEHNIRILMKQWFNHKMRII